MSLLLDVLAPIFGILACGYASVMFGLYSRSLIDGLLKFTQTFAVPVLLFKGLSELDLTQSFDPALLTSFYAGAFLCFLAGLSAARFLFKRDWENAIAIGFCCLFSNSLMLGLSITDRAYGGATLQATFVIVSIHAPFCYGLGILAMEIARARERQFWGILQNVLSAMFKNTIVLGILVGFLVNFFDLPIQRSIADAIDMIANTALALALFSMGGVLYRYRPSGDVKMILVVCFISLLLHPSLVWLFGKLIGLQLDGFRSAVLTSAMAPGINSYIFANMYGKETKLAASTVFISSVLCLFTAWGWLGLLS